MNNKGHKIKEIKPESIAEELDLEPGDLVMAINNQEIEDIFDYEFLIQEEYVELLIQKADQEEWILEIDKEYDEDLGIVFENGLMDEYRSCKNKCIFCFIDQMPPNMRDTLYFKDDDSRLSFLQGNYVTLTNMSDKDIQRIIKYKLSPINISVHTTDPELRCKMLHNRFAGDALKKIDTLFEAETPMNGQIVLCKGVNDKEHLRRTLRDLMAYQPFMQSVSVVPIGLTKFRDGLYQAQLLTKEDGINTIEIIEEIQQKSLKEFGTYFVQPSDEFYILAEKPIPEALHYEDYIQLENGVGMLRLFMDEVEESLRSMEGDHRSHTHTIATGVLAFDCILQSVEQVHRKFPFLNIKVYKIINHYFGETITVSGLITGTDLVEQLKEEDLGETLLLPLNMFMSGKEVLLDDMTKDQLQKALQVPINIVKSSGHDFVEALIYGSEEWICNKKEDQAYAGYELKEI